jgi:asparagine synthase (glutamine-hydrolysing)
MMQPEKTHTSRQSPKQMLTPHIAGWLYNANLSLGAETNIKAMQQAINTSLPLEQRVEERYACTSTSTLHKEQNCTVVIVGYPSWTEQSLTSAAKEKSQAYALYLAYTEYGAQCINYLHGAFSFAIIDTTLNQVIAGTDRLGQLPLYYVTTDEGIIFGSSVSSLLAHSQVPRSVQEQGVYDYLYFHMVPSPHSIYKNIKKLPAGHLLNYANGKNQISNYYLPIFNETASTSFEEMGQRLKHELKDAVSHCYDPTLKTAAFLSGGLDSSTVAGMLSEVSETTAEAYSIGFSAEGYDEMAFARITAKHFGVKLNEYYVTPEDVVDALPIVAASYDEPFGNSSALPAYFCAKVAAENGVQRLLAGDGGDELFGGNERYVKQDIFEAYGKIPNGLRKTIIEHIVSRLPSAIPLSDKARSYIDQANIPLPDRMQTYNFLHQHSPNEIFNEDFLNHTDTHAPLAILRNTYQQAENASTLNRMLYLDWQYTLADNDLRKVSHMCALAGVEVVYPMLNDNLVNFSCQVPSAWKIKKRDLRHFYKQSLTGWLPDATINKKKQGFGLPFGVWMETHRPLQEMAYDNLLKLKKRPYFKPEFIDQTIELHRNQHAAYYGELIWILMVLEMWMEAHI